MAEVCFVPNAIGRSKKGLEYRIWRYGADAGSADAAWMEEEEKGLLFRRCARQGEVQGFWIVTNMDWMGRR